MKGIGSEDIAERGSEVDKGSEANAERGSKGTALEGAGDFATEGSLEEEDDSGSFGTYDSERG